MKPADKRYWISKIFDHVASTNGVQRSEPVNPALVNAMNVELIKCYFDDYDTETRARAERTIANLLKPFGD